MELPPFNVARTVPGSAAEATAEARSLQLVRQTRRAWQHLRQAVADSEKTTDTLRWVILRAVVEQFVDDPPSVGSWTELLERQRGVYGNLTLPLLSHPGSLFDPQAYTTPPSLHVPDHAVTDLLRALTTLDGRPIVATELPAEHLGAVFEMLLDAGERRRRGCHYTPRALTETVVRATLRPHLEALGPAPTMDQILALRVHDPAVGAGAFLLESIRQLADLLVAAGAASRSQAQRDVAKFCISGVDQNPLTVEIAKLSVGLLLGARTPARTFLDQTLRPGDSLLDPFPMEPPHAIIGNPPFLGGKRIGMVLGAAYRAHLRKRYPGSNGNADLAAFFLRCAFEQLRPGGTCGFVTTNTIAQGDTRAAGLRWVCEHGGDVYEATKRVVWPGSAAVVVSIVHVHKGAYKGAKFLDGKPVQAISAFLFHTGSDQDPEPLLPRPERAFIGCFLRGAGFTFETADPRDPRIIGPAYGDVVFPYLGGEEVLTHPAHASHRFVIHFGARTESEVQQRWPHLYAHVARLVRPGRERLGTSAIDRSHRRTWWRFANDRPELAAALRGRTHVLVIPRLSRHLCVVRMHPGAVFSDQLVVVPCDHPAALALLQSRVHETWARFFSSTLGDGLRYAPSDCFDTFPFPPHWTRHAGLHDAAEAYDSYRAALLRATQEGLTVTYRALHDPETKDPRIEELRRRHNALDRATLDAYGWTDLHPTYTFFPTYGNHEHSSSHPRRGGWTYRWSDDIHDEVLARLLAANQKMARTNRLASAASPPGLDTADSRGSRPPP